MKKMNLLFLVLWLGLGTQDELAAQTNWKNQFNNLKTEFSVRDRKKKKNQELIGLESEEVNTFLMPIPVINVYFNNLASTYLSSSGDLNLDRGFAILDNSDGRLFLGGTHTFTKNKTFKLTHILSGGVKLNVKDNFAKVFDADKDKIQNDIGLSLKYTYLLNGIIYMTKKDKEKLKNKRAYLEEQMNKKIAAVKQAIENDIMQSATLPEEEKLELAQKEFKEKYGALKIERAESEAKLINEEKLYSCALNGWISIDGYAPFSKSEYNIGAVLNSKDFQAEEYRPWEGRVSVGGFFSKPRLNIYGRAYFSFDYNNSVRAEQLKKYSFEEVFTQSVVVDTVNVAVLKQNDVYVGDFKRFWTNRVGIEIMIFPWQRWVGISGSLERYDSGDNDFSGTNWKVGFPVSLKDKEGKAKVNFELLYRKLAGDKAWGISIGLPIGSIMYK